MSGFADGQGRAATFFLPIAMVAAPGTAGKQHDMACDMLLPPARTLERSVATYVRVVSRHSQSPHHMFSHDSVSGPLYVLDQGNHAVRVITLAGAVTTLAGTGARGDNNGVGMNASFALQPNSGIAISTDGTMLVRDTACDGHQTTSHHITSHPIPSHPISSLQRVYMHVHDMA